MGGARSTSSRVDSLASPSVMPGSDEARMMTATSGRSCTDVLTKSDPIGSCVRTLLESSRWSSRATLLKWRLKKVYSMRLTHFTDTDSTRPLPLNASATALKVTDIPSKRLLFQLAPLTRRTDETECSSLDAETILPTPVAQDFKKRGPNSKQQGIGDLVYGMEMLLPTPRSNEVNDMDLNNPVLAERNKSNLEEEVAKIVVSQGVADVTPSRLSPLFTEEMMGFPFLFTTLPFLRQSGEPNHSKPTETP